MDALGALGAARLIVVKIGSALLVDEPSGQTNRAWLEALARDVARLAARSQRVALVSSGAVALGRGRIGLGRRKLTLPEKQASAAAGQTLLMSAWQDAFAAVAMPVAQVLLTADDTENRRRFLNARATLRTLMDLGVTPVVNENDTVATEELRYGDNDRLAARVAQMLGADLLVLLSDIDGLYSADPKTTPGALRLDRIDAITPQIEAMAAGPGPGHGSGGMVTKLAAAQIAGAAGCATLIALGRRDAPLQAVEEGAPATWFAPRSTPAAAYKAWIAGSLAARGALRVDSGAVSAVRAGKSLLAAGMRSAEGAFGKGDAVRVCDQEGREIGRGLVRYDAADARRIVGLRSDAIEALLGEAAMPVIHADDFALAGERTQP